MDSGNAIDGNARHFSLPLPRALSAPGTAREQLQRWLGAVELDGDLLADILLCASELVTNAITHAESGPTLQAMLLGGQRLRLAVTDESSRRPVKRSAGTAAGGFGLRVVDVLASSWGWEPTADGKVVWATFDLADR